MDTAILIALHLSWLAWAGFTLWYGIRIKWEKSKYGVNTLLTATSLALALTLIEVSVFFPYDPWRPYVRLLVYSLIAAAGIQRIWFMATRERNTPEVEKRER